MLLAKMPGEILFLIDTDAGIDDAQAILIVLSQPDVKVLAITTVHGNTNIHQGACNVLRVLQVAGQLHIPVYKGCDQALIGGRSESVHHGKDGLGDAPDKHAPGPELIQKEHGVLTMIKLVREHPGEVCLLALGPLTNVALAQRLDPDFGKNLKHCYMMGGNMEAKGNVTSAAEFNFHTDPEAAKVVLQELRCPITLATWELCLKHRFSWDWYNNAYLGQNTPKSNFVKTVEVHIIETHYKPYPDKEYYTADQTIAAIAICPDVVKTSIDAPCSVELSGTLTRGQMVVEWREDKMKDERKVTIVTELDLGIFSNLLEKSVK